MATNSKTLISDMELENSSQEEENVKTSDVEVIQMRKSFRKRSKFEVGRRKEGKSKELD